MNDPEVVKDTQEQVGHVFKVNTSSCHPQRKIEPSLVGFLGLETSVWDGKKWLPFSVIFSVKMKILSDKNQNHFPTHPMFLKGSRQSDLRVNWVVAQFGAVGRVRLGELVKGTTHPDIQKKKNLSFGPAQL